MILSVSDVTPSADATLPEGTRCPSCGHLLDPGCFCPEDCPGIAEAETARFASLDAFLGSRGDLAPAAVAAGTGAVFALLEAS